MKPKKRIRLFQTSLEMPNIPFPKELTTRPQVLLDKKPLINSITDHEALSAKDIRVLADLATNLWRAKQRLVTSIKKGTGATESNKILRPIDSAMENLENIGVNIEDYTGKPYVQGMALNIVSSLPNSAAISDRIVETLKPTIFFRQQFIQAGDVIIEGPPSSQTSYPQS